MSKPGFFSDFTKPADDVFDHYGGAYPSIKIKSANRLAPFTINTNANRSQNGALAGDGQIKYKHSSGLAGSVKVDHNAAVKAEASYKVSNELNVKSNGVFNSSKGNSCTGTVEYKHDAFAATAGIDTAGSLKVNGSLTTCVAGVHLGGDAKYDTGAGKLAAYNAGVKYNAGNSTLFGLYKSNGLCSTLVSHKYSDDVKLAVAIDHDRKTKATTGRVGGEIDLEKNEKVAFKVGQDLKLAGSYQFRPSNVCSVNLHALVNLPKLNEAADHKLGITFTFEDSN